MLTPEQQNKANLDRVMAIAGDADAKAKEFTQLTATEGDQHHRDALYYSGVRDGLRRAASVLKGNG